MAFQISGSQDPLAIPAVGSKPKRPRIVLLLSILYALVSGALLLIAGVGGHDGDLSFEMRMLLGLGGIVVLVAAIGALRRIRWARIYCFWLHALIIIGVLIAVALRLAGVQGIGARFGDFSVVPGLGFQFVLAMAWTQQDVVAWFAWR